jgi:hypothetical protein
MTNRVGWAIEPAASSVCPPLRHGGSQAWGRLLDCDGNRRSAVGGSFKAGDAFVDVLIGLGICSRSAALIAGEAALIANNKKYTIYIYPGTHHAFNNDTGARPLQQGGGRSRLEPNARLLRGASGRAARRSHWE